MSNQLEKDARKLVINIVSGVKDVNMSEQEITWGELRNLLSVEHLRKGEMTYEEYHAASDDDRKADKDGAAWIPGSAIVGVSKRGRENMDKSGVLVLDIDEGIGLEEVKACISGFEAVIHSSHSSTPKKPKWRVAMPLAETVPARDMAHLFDCMQMQFSVPLDKACGHNPASLYYLPSCPAHAEHKYVFEHLVGEFLDAKAFVAKMPIVALTPLTVIPGYKSALAKSGGADVGSRNVTIFKLACKLFGTELDVEQVREECLASNAAFDPPLSEKEVSDVVASAQKRIDKKALAKIVDVTEAVELFNEDYAWIEKQGKVWRFKFRDFVNFDMLRQQYANTGMSVEVGGKEKWMNFAEIWQRSPLRRTHTKVDFIPGAGTVVDNVINLWEGWGVVAAKGDIGPWVALIDHIFGSDVEMKNWFTCWLAYPIQHPGAKMTTAAVLWSVNQGVGKTLIGETVGKIYGRHSAIISAAELHGSFNGWMKGCQFVLGEENSSADQRADANKLKILITGATIFVNEKYQPAFEQSNCANFLFTSNHADAFYLEDADRRFYIWEILAKQMPSHFYAEFVAWRDERGGLAALMDHLLTVDLTGFSFKDNAPVTEAKKEMISFSKTDIERWLAEVLEDTTSVLATFGKEVIHLDELTTFYCNEKRVRASTTAVSKAHRRLQASIKRRVPTKGVRKQLFSLANHDKWAMAENEDWVKEFEKVSPFSLD